MGNIGTCIYCQKAVNFDKVPLHAQCELEVLRKIRDYTYDKKINVTVDSIVASTGYSPRVAQRLIDYFMENGAFEEKENTSEKEALEMRRQQLEKESHQNSLMEFNKLLNEEKQKKHQADEPFKNNGFFTADTRRR